MKVLIVDDSKTMRRYVLGALTELPGAQVKEVDSCFEAFRILAREQFDVVITDINMPDINGLELIRFLRQSDRHQRTKIIVITTLSRDRTETKLEALGVDRFLSKPFEPDALFGTVIELVPGETTARSTQET